MVSELSGVPIAGPLLVMAIDLTDETVHVDDQPLLARSGTRRPRSPQCLREHPVKLADMTEGERAQKRPQRRRGRDPMPKHHSGLARAQHVAVIDAIRSERHRAEQRHHLAARVRRARPITEINGLVDQRLDPKASGEHRGKHHPGVSDRPLIVKHDPGAVRQTLHHAGDLLVQARRRPTRQLSA